MQRGAWDIKANWCPIAAGAPLNKPVPAAASQPGPSLPWLGCSPWEDMVRLDVTLPCQRVGTSLCHAWL